MVMYRPTYRRKGENERGTIYDLWAKSEQSLDLVFVSPPKGDHKVIG